MIINYFLYKKTVKKLKSMPLQDIRDAFAMVKIISCLAPRQQFLALATRGLYREEIHYVFATTNFTFNDVERMFEEFKELNIPYKFPKVS